MPTDASSPRAPTTVVHQSATGQGGRRGDTLKSTPPVDPVDRTVVDFETVRTLVPHYMAMLLLSVAGVTVVQIAVGDPPAPVVFGVVLVIVFGYPFLVRRLGYAPEFWE